VQAGVAGLKRRLVLVGVVERRHRLVYIDCVFRRVDQLFTKSLIHYYVPALLLQDVLLGLALLPLVDLLLLFLHARPHLVLRVADGEVEVGEVAADSPRHSIILK
jgi:hypothetical protein